MTSNKKLFNYKVVDRIENLLSYVYLNSISPEMTLNNRLLGYKIDL